MSKRYHLFEEKFLDPLRMYLGFVLALLLSLFLVRVYEIYFTSHQQAVHALTLNYLAKLFLVDLFFGLQLAALLYPVYWLLFLINKPLGKFWYCLFLLLIPITYLAIIQYFITTFVPLGADFWAYSWSDIQTTVSASSSLEWYIFLPFMAVMILPFVFLKLTSKIYLRQAVLALCLLVALSCSLVFSAQVMPKSAQYEQDSDYYLVENKGRFFLEKSIAYFDQARSEQLLATNDWSKNEYPFLKDELYPDVLSPYFNAAGKAPNLVFIQVEGLGKSFVGNNAQYAGFTPFLDSLIGQGLFWENFLSSAGRTFGILPSLYGSLPFGKDGFTEMGNNMPEHNTLIKELKNNGYKCNYFYGGNANFDKQDIFLEQQGVDFILDENQFPKQYQRMKANAEGFSWGYNDKDVLSHSLSLTAKDSLQPRLDIYMTLVTHEPFVVPDVKYKTVFDNSISKYRGQNRKIILQNRNVFECLLYTDDAIKEFIDAYKKRPEYSNTIFVITGDHRMIPVPHSSKIDRFHVPFLIWSPLLKTHKTFKSVGTHSQVTPTILSFLKKNYGMSFSGKQAFIAPQLGVNTNFESKVNQAIMRNKSDLSIYLMGNYFLSDGALYEMKHTLALSPVKDEQLLNKAMNELADYKQKDIYVCSNNKLFRSNKPKRKLTEYLNKYEQAYLKATHFDTMLTDNKFYKARELAALKQFSNARILLKDILLNSPNYTDARILYGRTLYWEGDYAQAGIYLREAIKRSPNYEDAYVALIDCELKAAQYQSAVAVLNQALTQFPDNENFLFKKAEALAGLKQYVAAHRQLDTLLKKYPKNKDARLLLRRI